jgi:acetolactate synthase-1/2/3 large subunit
VFKEPHVITQNGPSKLYEVAEVLSQQLVGDETVVTDAGSCFYVMGQGFRLKKSQRYVVSGSLGAMGFALPAALGIACADNAQNCICVTGDGSLQTNVHELAALSKHSNLNIKLFVICNEGYASIRKTQNEYFDGFLAGTSDESGVFIPPLEKLCDAYGLQYVPCPTREGLSGAIATALDRKGVIVVGISSQFNQEIIPSVGSVRLPDGTMRSGSLHEMKPLLP